MVYRVSGVIDQGNVVGFFKTTGKVLGGAARLTGKLGVGALKASGTALNATAKLVAAHQHDIADATKAAVNVSGRVVKAHRAGRRRGSGGCGA